MMPNQLLAAGPNSKYQTSGSSPAGFLDGLWHGIICPITLIISFFSPNVRIYETHNTGVLYDLGFVIGASGSLVGSRIQAGN